MMLLVSGSTRTVARLAPQWPDRLGHLLTPANRNGMGALLATGLRWAVDNGAFKGFQPQRFRRLLRRVAGQPRLLWVACPDMVADARATLARFEEWEPELRAAGVPVAFVAQDGQENLPVPWERIDCLFIGGSTDWKLGFAWLDLAQEAKARSKWLHCGRVNSLCRMQAMYDRGCDSIDGSSASMFGDTYIPQYLHWLAALERQPTLF